MILYSMTATFGKLEHETLTLKPGLNVIQAPNEWGKSTWCAFLLAMLYGLDTRAKATRTSLPDKERYAPWSGSPMSGRVELCWKGRDITIERSTKGRIPLGEFRAYETASGMPVPELNGANCGQLPLGVARSVFQRAGFIRQSDLPVTQDEDLRRRLNALVTTGDESGDAARLEKGLRELKNRCRYNRSGLLPQAVEEKARLEAALAELEDTKTRLQGTQAGLEANAAEQAALTNHLAALAYEQAQGDARRVAQARTRQANARQRLKELEEACAGLPALGEIEQRLENLRAHREQLEQFRQQALPVPPEAPEVPEAFLGMTPAQALHQAQTDAGKYRAGSAWLPMLLGFLCVAAAGGLVLKNMPLAGAIFAGIGAAALALGAVLWLGQRSRRRTLCRRYGNQNPQSWEAMARSYARDQEDYRRRQREASENREQLAARRRALGERQRSLCGDMGLEQCFREWERQRALWQQMENARLEAARASRELETLEAMARSAPAPERSDDRRESPEETKALLSRLEEQERLLRGNLGQYRGRMEALGSETELRARLERVSGRIRELERYDYALTLAQQTLVQAREELQRRFAPRITQGAQQLLARLTLGRYDRLLLGSDLSIQAGAGEENVLRSALWRSDGTADQLYLALRLSVARELTPDAPLILDDALVRFDDDRLKAAMAVLKEYAQSHQVIVFTCQTRESAGL